MKLTLQNIKSIKQKTTSLLTKRVCNYVIENWTSYDNKKAIFTDVLNYGCQSGIVSDLIYYSDTVKFYNKYKDEINELLYCISADCEIFDLSQLFGDKWDKEDPLANETTNQNLLAWFGFEETLRNIGMQFEELQDCI